MIKVVKFGGSSLADAVQIKKAGKIVLSEESRRYVVPSAPGKRNKNDTKVTDMLYACYEAASTGASYGKLTDVLQTGANDVYEVRDESGKTVLIPAIPDVVLETDLDAGTMQIRPLEGLFDED